MVGLRLLWEKLLERKDHTGPVLRAGVPLTSPRPNYTTKLLFLYRIVANQQRIVLNLEIKPCFPLDPEFVTQSCVKMALLYLGYIQHYIFSSPSHSHSDFHHLSALVRYLLHINLPQASQLSLCFCHEDCHFIVLCKETGLDKGHDI